MEGDIGLLLTTNDITEQTSKRCSRAKEIRKSLKNMHTAGPKSFARIRDEMKNEDPNKEFPTLSQMFERTRKKTDGHVYVDTYDDTTNKIVSLYFNFTIIFPFNSKQSF
uniref:Uncharacterized protein n=1 Tax=Lactuca sativa TaxID=4236 RepID=A0A9R1WJ12_LACSA|nr:hypothetical protein LSAT_V11C200082230 [Lactuca sativa]